LSHPEPFIQTILIILIDYLVSITPRYTRPTQDEEIETASKTAAAASTLGTVNIVVRALTNGEKRMCIELRERKKREELLRKMGLIDDAGKPLVAGRGGC